MNIFEKFWSPIKKDVNLTPAEKIETEEGKSPIPNPDEKIFVSSELGEEKELNGSSTGARFIKLRERGKAGIFKLAGSNKERAAYVVDKFLNLNFVPATVLRNIGGETGSFQEFITHAKTGIEISDNKIPQEQLKELRFFDFLIGNGDRHDRNFLIKGKKIFAIDHHSSFWPGKWGYKRYEILGENIPPRLKDAISSFSKWQDGKRLLNGFLTELLTNEEVTAFWKRFECLTECAKKGKFLNGQELEELKI